MKPRSKLRSLAQRAWTRRTPPVEPATRMRRRADRQMIDGFLADATRDADIVFAMIEIDCLVPDLDLFSGSPPVQATTVDEALMEAVGDMIARNIRPDDVVYRTNLNEFGVFLNDVTMVEAANVTGRVATAVNGLFTAEMASGYTLDIGMADSRTSQSASLVDQARLDLRSRQRGHQ